MTRKSGWRQVCPEPVWGRQLSTLFCGSRISIVRQNGPAAYVLQEEDRRKALKVCQLCSY